MRVPSDDGEHTPPSALVGNKKIVITSLISGGCAGAAAKTVIAPLERVKIIFQTNHHPFSVVKAFRTVGTIYNNEGLMALWKGHIATLVRIVPFASIQFMSHEQYLLMASDSNGEISSPLRFLAGSAAGATATTLTYPLDAMRARMAVSKHSSLKEGLVHMQQQGVRITYRGLIPTLAGIIPYAGTSFFAYGRLLQEYSNQHGREVGTVPRLACGALAGLCGQTISYPLDIVRRRMQTDEIGTGRRYYTIVQTVLDISHKEGWRGMYKGLSLNWIKGPVAVAISFTTYDTVSLMMGGERRQ
eukprot:CFRG4217T1